MTWPDGTSGLVQFPSGRRVRGRGLREGLKAGEAPTFGVYLTAKQPPQFPWESRWIQWRDFWLPANKSEAQSVLSDAWERAIGERVEVACGGGVGRTGTALACMAIIDGVPAAEATAFVRSVYRPRAVETPWQKHYVRNFGSASA